MNRLFPEETPRSRISLTPDLGQPQPRSAGSTMNVPTITVSSPGLNLRDIYYILFRHKWKILLCATLGVAGAAAMYRLMAPPYQSEAKLFVRYIITENKALGPSSGDTAAKSPDQRGETIMKSEAEILGSLDLARQVAETVGPARILAKFGGGKDVNAAIAVIKANLSVSVAPASSVIHVIFQHPDPEIVQPVLREVIDRYFKLHVETHTANGMLGDFLTQETDQLRSRLSQTEEELRKATGKAGVISLEDAKKANAEQLVAIRRELFSAQAELAQRTAVLEELKRKFPTQEPTGEVEAPLPPDVLARYEDLTKQVQGLQEQERAALMQFKPTSARVTEVRELLAAALEAHTAMQKKYPKLVHVALAATRGPDAPPMDPNVVGTQITALEAKIKVLTSQLEDVRRDATKVDQMEGTITELRRKKELDEANYRYFAANLEQSRINETLGNGRVSNISQIQTPSPPSSDRSQANKKIGLLLGGGLFAGIVWAFLIELYFDHSIKRSVDLERTLQVPLFISIPRLQRKALKELKAAPLMLTTTHGAPAANGGASPNGATGTNGSGPATAANNHAPVPVAPPLHPLQAFHETLRDRLIGFFESINLTHKPKLVAVTSLGREAGVTTTAAGLARSLSETGEGNVLLVDMNEGPGVAQQFSKGRPVCGLDELLDARQNAHVDERLYVVAENSQSDRLSRNMPQRFSKLVPKLKASDFDYIIFDMPPVSQISITPRLAGFMDMVLIVVESEKTDRDLVQRATMLLGESGAQVGLVLNKTKRYVPGRLVQDSLCAA